MKARSYRGVLMAGFQLYTGNFRRLFKGSWQMALLYAACSGLLATLTAIKLPEITAALVMQYEVYQTVSLQLLRHYTITVLEAAGLSLLAIAAMSLASATILALLRSHRNTGVVPTPPHWLTASPALMGRTLKGVFFTLLILLLPLLGFVGLAALAETVSPQFVAHHIMTVTATFGICTALALALSLPLMHVLMKYLMEPAQGYWPTLRHNYGRALRHWGSLLLVFFLSLLLVSLASMVIMTPSLVLNLANQQAHAGLLIGDPLGMPSYILPLTFATAMLCNFIQFYISQATLVHNYYSYGSIETQKNEREQQTPDML